MSSNDNTLEKLYQELKKHSESQFRQITELQKSVDKFRDENTQLKGLLGQSISVAQAQVKESLTDEEYIAENEIKKLRELSEKQSLTFEETKKLVEYVKILQTKRSKKDSTIDDNYATEDLFKLLNEKR